MQILSEQAREISAYIETHPAAEIGKWPVEINGEKNILSTSRKQRTGLVLQHLSDVP